MSSLEPGPRRDFFSFERHSSVYVWGGEDDSNLPVNDLDYLYQFSYTTGAWTRHLLKDQHPPGVYEGCCARIKECVYFYGGYDESRELTGSLYKLNLTTLTWLELSPPKPGSPRKKSACRIITHNNTLVIHGGGTCSIRGDRTNETHIFDIATETWSSPQITGDVPKPDRSFAFSKVSQNKEVKCGQDYDDDKVVKRGQDYDDDKVVKCGGGDNAIYVLNLSTMHWTKVLQYGPVLGPSPTATCIGYGSDHAQLLTIGWRVVCLFDVATWEFKKLQDTDLLPRGKYLKRACHNATMLSSTPTSVEILIFGGLTYSKSILSSTTLLLLKKNEDAKWWRITDGIKGDELKDRRIHLSGPAYEEQDSSAAEVQHVDEDKLATDKNESQVNNGRATQEKADSASTPSQTSQPSSSQSSPASSQAAPIHHEDTDVKEHSKALAHYSVLCVGVELQQQQQPLPHSQQQDEAC